MNESSNNHDLVDQAVGQMLAEPTPDGPSPAVITDTLAALKKAAPLNKPTLFRQFTNAPRLYKIAAALAILLGGTILVLNLVGGGTIVSAARILRESRTMSCLWTMDMPAMGKPVSMNMMFMEPGLMRVELPGTALTILNTAKNKLLVLNQPTRTAVSVDLGGPAGPPPNQALDMVDWIEKIKNTRGQQAQNIGTRTIDGIEARGYLLSEQGMEYTVWADVRSGMPVRIEIPLELPSIKTTVVMSNLVFDKPLDATLFDIEPPPGYMRVNLDLPMLAGAPGEDDIVELLRWYTDKSRGGVFPKALDSWMDFIKVSKQPGQRPDQKELMGIMMHAGRVTAFLGGLGPGKFGYLGADAKLGEKDRIIFWYHVEGTDSYRAIFGDLRIEDIRQEQVPSPGLQ